MMVLMVNSTPIIIRSLTGVFPQSFRALTPVASVIADYAAFVVPKNSKYTTFDQIIEDFKKNPNSVKVAGGSVKGSMDHLVPAMVIQAAGANPLKLKCIPYDAGGKAMAGLLSGDTQVLSTGYGEALGLARQGEVNILAVTSGERLAQTPDVPTVKELGYNVTFANWRGFYGIPGLSEEKAAAYQNLLKSMYDTPEWENMRSKRGWQNLISPVRISMHSSKSRKRLLATSCANLAFCNNQGISAACSLSRQRNTCRGQKDGMGKGRGTRYAPVLNCIRLAGNQDTTLLPGPAGNLYIADNALCPGDYGGYPFFSHACPADRQSIRKKDLGARDQGHGVVDRHSPGRHDAGVRPDHEVARFYPRLHNFPSGRLLCPG